MIPVGDLVGLRAMVAGFYQTEVQIFHRSDSTSSTAWDDSVKAALPDDPDLTVMGWVRSKPNPDLADDLAAVVNEEQTRLFVPVGTVIEKGDAVKVEGEAFTVIDTNAQNTYKVLLRCSLRRIE